MSRNSNPPLALLAAVTAIGFSALHMVAPVLPVLATAFDRSAAAVQLVLTLFFAGIAVGQLFYGPVSDRFGRRPVLLAGLVLFLAGSVICGAAWSLPVLVAGRVLQALGGCAGLVLGRAIIRDVCDREASTRAIALVMMAMTLAPALCPALGAYLTEWFGWRTIFVFLGGLGAIVLVLSAARLVETHPSETSIDLVGVLRAHGRLACSREFVLFGLASACSSASWFTFIASAPILVSVRLHQPPSTYGAMILIPMAAYMLGNAAAAHFGRRFGSRTLFLAGVAISLASGALMGAWCAAALSTWALFVPMALSSIGNGLSQPPAFAAGLSVYPHIAGTASGVMGFLQMAMSALGSLAVGMLPHDSALAMVAVVFAAQALSFACAVLALRQAGAVVAAPAVGAEPTAGPAGS